MHKVIPAFVPGEINQENVDRLIAKTKEVNDGSLQRYQYQDAILKSFGQWVQPERKSQRGPLPRPRRVPPPDLLYGKVVKHRRKGWVVKVTTRVVFGTLEALVAYLEGSPVSRSVNTAFVERQNNTMRQHNLRFTRNRKPSPGNGGRRIHPAPSGGGGVWELPALSPWVERTGAQVFEVTGSFAAEPQNFSPQAVGISGSSDLLYSTFLGGSAWDDGWGIALDSSGNAYVTGWTHSSDFPTTPGAFDRTYNGSSEVFVARLGMGGGAVTYSISGRVVDASGNPFPGVTISDNAGHTTTTGSDGRYTLSGLAAGTYIITPSRIGYIFSPASRQVTVPPDATGQNFTAEMWTFAVITDLHIGYGIPDYGTPGWNDDLTNDRRWDEYYLTERVKKFVDWINENASTYHIKLVAVLGDITDTAQRSQFKKAKELLDQLSIP